MIEFFLVWDKESNEYLRDTQKDILRVYTTKGHAASGLSGRGFIPQDNGEDEYVTDNRGRYIPLFDKNDRFMGYKRNPEYRAFTKKEKEAIRNERFEIRRFSVEDNAYEVV